jgi:predicted DNA binding CopG/RHH family protein
MKKSKAESMSILEASDFFDEHDLFERDNVVEVKNITFELAKKKYVGVDSALFKKIKNKAKKLHMNEDALINAWLKEKAG